MEQRAGSLAKARMVKSADTADLKSADPYQVVGVQVPLRAPSPNHALWFNLFTVINIEIRCF
jgi:hypothetical protein